MVNYECPANTHNSANSFSLPHFIISAMAMAKRDKRKTVTPPLPATGINKTATCNFCREAKHHMQIEETTHETPHENGRVAMWNNQAEKRLRGEQQSKSLRGRSLSRMHEWPYAAAAPYGSNFSVLSLYTTCPRFETTYSARPLSTWLYDTAVQQNL